MGINSEIYNLSGGKIQIGSLSGEQEKGNLAKSIASASYNYAANGARDRDQNAFYDNYMRAYNTGAVISAVMHTSKERTAEHAYNSINWNNKETKASMERMGVLSSSANEQFKNISNQAGLNKTQKSQAGFTGKTIDNKELKNSTCDLGDGNTQNINHQIRDAKIQADNETARNSKIMSGGNSTAKRAKLSEIRDKQIAYLKKVSVTGNFDGSIKSAKNEIEANKRQIASLQNQLNKDSTLTKDAKDKIYSQIQKYKDNITDLQNYIDTGAKANVGADKGKGYRAHGRSMIFRNFVGNDMYRGIAFYKGLGKVTSTSVKTAMKASIGAPTTLVKGIAYMPAKVAGKIAPNSKFAKVTDNIVKGADNVKNAAYRKIDYSKLSKEAKKQEKINKRLDKRDKTNKRLAKFGDKQEAKLNKLKGYRARVGGNSKLDKKIAKLEKRQKNFTRLLGMRNRRIQSLDNIRAFKGKTRSVLHAPQRGLRAVKNAPKTFVSWATRKPRTAIKRAKNKIKDEFKKILKKLLGEAGIAILGMIAAIISSIFPFIAIICLFMAFFGANPASELADELKDVNYIQLIVNETSNTLGRQFTNTAIKQAETYYLTPGNTVENPKYNWTRSVDNATLQSIWASEDMNYTKGHENLNQHNTQLRGISANLVPIVSMMHYRFGEDINFDNYYTAKGYVFFMYVRSHDVAYLDDDDEDNDKYAYTYDIQSDCPDEDVFTSMAYDENTQTVTRGETNCNNVYIHGYTSDYNKFINQKRALLSTWLGKSNTNLGLPGTGEANGVFIGHSAPSDSKSTCDNYNTYRGTLECTKPEHNHESSGEHWDWDCGKDEHTHSDNCYKWIVEESWDGTYNDTIHKETDEADYNYDNKEDDDYEEKESCYEWQDEYSINIYYECGEIRRVKVEDYEADPDAYSECLYVNSDFHIEDHDNHDIKRISDEFVSKKRVKKVMICNGHHEHDESCKNYIDTSHYDYNSRVCGKEEHTHNENCHEGWIKSDGTLCTTEAHTHDPWNSENDYGCYYTAYVCKGHCGGHIKPSINIVMDMEFKTLMMKDCYKITYFLAESDFDHQSTEGANTIDEWKDNWIKKQKVWFYPVPSSPKAALQWGKNKVISTVAKFGSWLSGNGWTLSTKQFSTNDENTDNPDDVFEFKGWGFNRKINGQDYYKYYDDVLSDMHDLYGDYRPSINPDINNGTWEGNYSQAIEIFEDFDISFPYGFNMSPNNDQKQSVLESIKKYNPDISDKRYKFIEYALETLGRFYYSESKGGQTGNAGVNAESNGKNNLNGPSTSDAFVIGRLRRNNIISSSSTYSMTGESLYNSGDFDHRQKKSGDILVTEDGKMAIYIGHLDKIEKYIVGTSTNTTPDKWSEEGEGNYIIECSEEYGGSILRKINDSDLRMYRIVKINNY